MLSFLMRFLRARGTYWSVVQELSAYRSAAGHRLAPAEAHVPGLIKILLPARKAAASNSMEEVRSRFGGQSPGAPRSARRGGTVAGDGGA